MLDNRRREAGRRRDRNDEAPRDSGARTAGPRRSAGLPMS